MTVTVEPAEELPVDLTGGLELLGASGELFLDGGEGGFELFHPGVSGGGMLAVSSADMSASTR